MIDKHLISKNALWIGIINIWIHSRDDSMEIIPPNNELELP